MPSAPTTITDLPPSCAARIAAAGIFQACAALGPVISTLTGVPTLSRPERLSILTQTSMVVLPGSSAGLINVTEAATGESIPGTRTEAASPTFNCCAMLSAMCALASRLEVSITVSRGVPAAAVSPANKDRSVTTPSIGLRISA